MRGMQNEETAELMTSAYRNYYNFIKPHSSIDGLTPALKAGIGVDLEGISGWLSLKRASKTNHNATKRWFYEKPTAYAPEPK